MALFYWKDIATVLFHGYDGKVYVRGLSGACKMLKYECGQFTDGDYHYREAWPQFMVLAPMSDLETEGLPKGL